MIGMKLVRNAAIALSLVASPISAQNTGDAPKMPNDAPIATSVARGGYQANLIQAARMGDRLIVKIRFLAMEGVDSSKIIYGPSLNAAMYKEEFYLLAGDKKYLLLKDSAGIPLAPPSLDLTPNGPVAGSWFGNFPAPPADVTSAMLFLPYIEPLGPFELK